MTNRQQLLRFVVFSISTVLFSVGCATRSQSFSNALLPTPPPPAIPDIPLEQPPRAVSPIYYNETPNLSAASQPEIERRLSLSEERFEAGKRAYQAGDFALARQAFDRALDVLLSAPEDLADRRRLEHRLDEIADVIYRYDLDRLGAGEKKSAVVYDKSPLETMLELTFPIDPKLKPKVKEEVNATVSQLPLEENDSVLSYINFFSTERGRKVLLYGLKRGGRFKPLIQRILDEEGVPRELMSLAQAESAFMPRAVSYKSATGMWQFMQFTGRQYGLNQTASCDERLDPEKSTRAAARHLHDLYNMFGDWYLAMAAYNCGPNCVDSAVQRTGFADFWELSSRNALPQQTKNYVPLILAMTIMAKNPKDYGLENIELDRPLEYDSIELSAATSIDLAADAADRPSLELRELNPALLKSVAPAGYQMHVPKGTANSVTAALEGIPEMHRASWRLHRVEQGETLAAISKRYAVSADSIAAANNRALAAPEAGDLLVIPVAPAPERQTARKNTQRSRKSNPAVAQKPAQPKVSPQVANRRATPPVEKTASAAPVTQN